MTAHIALKLLVAPPRRRSLVANLITVDLDNWKIDAILVQRNPDCDICGRRR
jgi:hypothetical protein